MKRFIFILVFFYTVIANSQTTVFPGAQGFGAEINVAGRGGQIVRVNSLMDDGSGGTTLREAIAVVGPKTIVFEVGGQIDAVDWFTLGEPFCTIAGQTAPSPGITIKNFGIRIRTHDVLVQHIRVRVGDESTDPCSPWPCDGPAETADAFEVLASTVDAYNVAVDHCSFSWAIDENVSVYNPNATFNTYNVDFTWCIISEALSEGHGNPLHTSDGLLYGSSNNGAGQYNHSVIKCLLASNNARNPTNQAQNLFFANNYIDNWAGKAIVVRYQPYGGSAGFGDQVGMNIIGNYYREGDDTQMGPQASWIEIDGPSGDASDWPAGSFIYEDDNVRPVALIYTDDDFSAFEVFSPQDGVPGYVPFASEDIPSLVLQGVGARPRNRDDVDKRIIADVIANNGSIIDSQADVGGWPTLIPTTRPFIEVDDPTGIHHNGWTNLEWQLHILSQKLIRKTAFMF